MARKVIARFFALLLMLLIGAGSAAAQGRQVAITVDDLPRGGDGGPYDLASLREMTAKLLRPFRDRKIPVIGFVNAGRRNVDPDGLREILDLWLDAGAALGNHSYSHPDINRVALDTYTADIVQGEPAIRAALAARGKKLEFYRHPFLHLGTTEQVKQDLQSFLDRRSYRVAPVTFDNADYAFAAVYLKPAFRQRVRREYVPYMESVIGYFERRSVEVAGREFPQVLLMHANQLNADLLPELLDMLQRRGYEFVTLERALQDPVYQLPDNYVGRNGFSWIHRWSRAKGMPPQGEPDAPEWVMQNFSADP